MIVVLLKCTEKWAVDRRLYRENVVYTYCRFRHQDWVLCGCGLEVSAIEMVNESLVEVPIFHWGEGRGGSEVCVCCVHTMYVCIG